MRLKKEQDLDEFLTNRYINKIKQSTSKEAESIVTSVVDFTQNMQRLGIEDGPNLDALNSKAQPSKGLQGFSYAATMNKIKESKKNQDFIRKEKEIRQRKQKVDQV